MARPNKPWYWKARKEWCVKVNGVRHRLGPDEDEALGKFHEILSKPQEVLPSGSVAEMIELFMDRTHVKRPKSYCFESLRTGILQGLN